MVSPNKPKADRPGPVDSLEDARPGPVSRECNRARENAVSPQVVGWIATDVLPFEGDVRSWLRRAALSHDDADDLIQEAFCRISQLNDVSRILSAKAYLFTTVRNLLRERIRRDRVVRFESMAGIDLSSVADAEPLADQVVAARERLRKVDQYIAELAPRCRRVVELRRKEGLSQRETAARLGVSENVVEKQLALGLRILVARLGAADRAEADAGGERKP